MVPRHVDSHGCNGLGYVEHFVHTHLDASLGDDALQFLVHLVCYETDAYVSLNPAFGEVEHRAHVERSF